MPLKTYDLLEIGYVIVFLFVVVVLSSTDNYGEIFKHSSSNGQTSNKIQPSSNGAIDKYASKLIQRQCIYDFALNDTFKRVRSK